MQFAKDSFYMGLRERLAAQAPQRTVMVNGVVRPAILVVENEAVNAAEPLANAFYLCWGGARIAKSHAGGERPLLVLECTIAYRTGGSGESGMDRGRKLGELDQELLAICQPGWTPKRDYTQSPAVELGTNVFWNVPELGDAEAVGSEAPTSWRKSRAGSGAKLLRLASLSIYFFAEMEQR